MPAYIPRDIADFPQGYLRQSDDPRLHANLDFYRNVAPMQPDGLMYEEFMQKYGRDWYELEANHGFIQWLFPIHEQGVNYRAHPLQKHELEAMRADVQIIKRIERSYSTMLAFYGIDFNEGHLCLSSNSAERLQNLSQNAHNLLRITRILKCISLFPTLQPHAAVLVTFFAALHEDGHIDMSPGRMHGGSLDKFWAGCFRNEGERGMVLDYVGKRGRFRGRREGKVGKRRTEEDVGSGKLGVNGEGERGKEKRDEGMQRWEAWYASQRSSMPPVGGETAGIDEAQAKDDSEADLVPSSQATLVDDADLTERESSNFKKQA